MSQTKSDLCHALTGSEVAARQKVTVTEGLSQREALERAAHFGPNQLLQQKPVSAVVLIAHQFRSLIVWLLATAAGFSLLVGDPVEAAAIGTVLALNAAIGFFTELRAARSMEALQKMADVRTRVRRDGHERMIDARDLVPGDVVLLEGGDVVTADLRLMSASNLQVDQSVLTGESAPVEKSGEPVGPHFAASERSSMVFKGTSITQGACEAIVVGTAMNTELGRISRLAESAEAEASPLEVRLERLGRTLIWLTLVMAAGPVAAGLYRGHEFAEMVRTGIALAVAAIPEGLPVVATLSLARGMWRMSRRNAMIRRLSAVETLGATTLILTDKTGTLTENRMTAVRYLLEGGEVNLEDGTATNSSEAFQLALKIGALCNTAQLGRDGGEDTGDPMELALLQAAETAGEGKSIALKQLAHHAFDPRRRMMATVHGAPDGVLVAVKGAPEAVLAACTQVLAPTGIGPLDEAVRGQWLRRNQEEAATGLRTLGLAMKQASSADADSYNDLVLLGIVCLADPLRSEIPLAIAACRAAGIRVVMVTGDHAATASRIARDAGIAQEGSGVVEGREILGLEAVGDELLTRLRAADVVARVAPDTKLALVALYQQEGEIVAMTGDGVNDAPALRKADIGVAMGQRGTQVAREAAHMVLKDDDFATIVEAVRQGRVIFGNIRKFIIYLMSCNLCEVLVVALAVGAGLPAPLLPLQILFLNLVTDVFPAFALGLGQGDGQEMTRAPRDPSEPIVGKKEWMQIAVLGGLLTVATLLAFAIALFWLDLAEPEAVTVSFLTLALAQLWNVFNVRNRGTGVLRNDVTRNLSVWGALALCLVLIGLALWVPALSEILRLPSPGLSGLVSALLMSFLPLVLGQFLAGGRGEQRAATPLRSSA